MTPTESEKQAALAWADRHDPYPTSGGAFFDECRYATVLAAALRQAEAELEIRTENYSYQRQRADAVSSRLKTLEEENARMREALEDAAKRFDSIQQMTMRPSTSKERDVCTLAWQYKNATLAALPSAGKEKPRSFDEATMGEWDADGNWKPTPPQPGQEK